MIKKIFLTAILSLFICISAMAANIQYENIKDGQSITVKADGLWTISNKKDAVYYTKHISSGTGSYSDFYTPDGELLFSTGTQYEFIYKGNLIGYSNADLKFYQFWMRDGILQQNELTVEEVKSLFKDFEIVNISQFSNTTNSLKLKKNKKHYKIILHNDTDRYFYHYGFSSHNAKFNTYPLRGFLDITKNGMIQFSHFGDNTKENPWFILLVR